VRIDISNGLANAAQVMRWRIVLLFFVAVFCFGRSDYVVARDGSSAKRIPEFSCVTSSCEHVGIGNFAIDKNGRSSSQNFLFAVGSEVGLFGSCAKAIEARTNNISLKHDVWAFRSETCGLRRCGRNVSPPLNLISSRWSDISKIYSSLDWNRPIPKSARAIDVVNFDADDSNVRSLLLQAFASSNPLNFESFLGHVKISLGDSRRFFDGHYQTFSSRNRLLGNDEGGFHIAALFFGIFRKPIRRDGKNNGGHRKNDSSGEQSGSRNRKNNRERVLFQLSPEAAKILVFFFAASVIGTLVHLAGWFLVVIGDLWWGIIVLTIGAYLVVSGPLGLSYRWTPLSGFWRRVL